MRVTQRVKKLLSLYESDNPGTKTSLARLLMEGRLAGTGRLMLLPIEQGTIGRMPNPAGFDPQYHFQIAVDSGLSGLIAPLGMLEAGADSFAGAIPLILKMNSTDSTNRPGKSHGIIGSVRDALRLGCVGIGCSIQLGMEENASNYEDIRSLVEEAKASGLSVILWSLPADGSPESETALDSTTHAAHVASVMGAHMICVKIPTSHLHSPENERHPANSTLSDRVRHVRQSCFNGRRLVVFAGNDLETDADVYEDVRGIRDGNGHGYILPQNVLHRAYEPAIQLLDQSLKIYQGKA